MANSTEFSSKFLEEFEILPWDPDQGAFGTVYKVKEKLHQDNPINSVPTVIKIIEACNKNDFTINYTISQFNYPKYAEREIKILATLRDLNHPNILQILKAWLEHVPRGFRGYPKKTPVKGSEGVYVIRTEWCDQGSVSKWLKSAWRCESDGWKIVYQIASALNFLHEQKIIHRDLKPANILLKTEGNQVLVKISDFGLATEARTRMTSRVGTKSYRSPELGEPGGVLYSFKADIFSFGVILFQILVHCKFNSELEQKFSSMIYLGAQEEEPSKMKWRLSKENAELIRAMISHKPDNRPTCPEIISKLQCIPDISSDIQPFDTKPEHFVWEEADLDLNVVNQKCQILTLLTLNNVSVQISELMRCLERCTSLRYLDLSISQTKLGNEFPYKILNLRHLRSFNLHHLNKLCFQDEFQNITQITERCVKNLLFFSHNISSQIISNKMTISLKLRELDICQIDIVERKFVTFCESALAFFSELLSEYQFEIIRAKMMAPENLKMQEATCRDLELYNVRQPDYFGGGGKLFSGFNLLERLYLDGCPKTLRMLDFGHLPDSLNVVFLKAFKIQLPKKPLKFSILTFDQCELPDDFVTAYEHTVGVLTIMSCQVGDKCCQNFDLIWSVLQTAWEIIRLKPFFWSYSQEMKDYAEELIKEYFVPNGIPNDCEMIEIIGKNNDISEINTEFEYEN